MSGGLLSMAKRQFKRQMIRGALETIATSQADRFLTSPAGRGAIFTLHHVRPERDLRFKPNRHLSVTPEFLEQAIAVSLDRGLVPVHVSDLPALLSDRSDQRKFVCFTLDDGFRDNAEYAAPIFRKYNIPYTIFIAPGFIERTRTMWWETAEVLTRDADSFFFDFGSGMEQVRSTSILEKWLAFERFLDLFHGPIDEDEAIARLDRAARDCGVDAGQIVEDQVMDLGELEDSAAGSPGAAGRTHAHAPKSYTRKSGTASTRDQRIYRPRCGLLRLHPDHLLVPLWAAELHGCARN